MASSTQAKKLKSQNLIYMSNMTIMSFMTHELNGGADT